jgi:IMP dehydrogenase
MAETMASRGGLAVLPQDIPAGHHRQRRGLGEVKAIPSLKRRSCSRPTTPSARHLMLLPKRPHRAAVVVDEGRPVGIRD